MLSYLIYQKGVVLKLIVSCAICSVCRNHAAPTLWALQNWEDPVWIFELVWKSFCWLVIVQHISASQYTADTSECFRCIHTSWHFRPQVLVSSDTSNKKGFARWHVFELPSAQGRHPWLVIAPLWSLIFPHPEVLGWFRKPRRNVLRNSGCQCGQ